MKNMNLDAATPEEIPAILRQAAESFRESRIELQSAWQDSNAGIVWDKLADTLEKAANEAEKKIARWV